MGRTQHVLLCTFCMCIATLMPSLTLADERPSDKPNTVFLPLTLQERDGTTVSSNPPPVTPTPPVTPVDPAPSSPTPVPPTPTAPAPTPSTVVLTPLEAEVVRLTNEVRVQRGCVALTISPELTIAARAHSQDMADHDYFDPSNTDLINRLKAVGYSWTRAGENIAAGSKVAKEVVNQWIDDPTANIFNCEYKDIGIGFVDDTTDVYPSATAPYYYYWTQDFGTRP